MSKIYFLPILKRKRKFDHTPLKLNLSNLELERVASQSYRFPEIIITTELKRVYPYGQYFSHVIGYLSRINERELKLIDEKNYAATNYIGKIGIEKSYEDTLHGATGEETIEVNAYGRKLNTLKTNPARNGDNLTLTIDHRLQQFVYDSLQNKPGSVVAINPQNGEILAMVSTPAFDPNLFVSHLSHQQYSALQNSEDKPLFNRSIRGQYPPASTIKPLMILQGLEENLITAESEIYDRGFYKLPHDRHLYRDWKSWGHGWMGPHRAIVESCDTFFYDLAY